MLYITQINSKTKRNQNKNKKNVFKNQLVSKIKLFLFGDLLCKGSFVSGNTLSSLLSFKTHLVSF